MQSLLGFLIGVPISILLIIGGVRIFFSKNRDDVISTMFFALAFILLLLELYNLGVITS